MNVRKHMTKLVEFKQIKNQKYKNKSSFKNVNKYYNMIWLILKYDGPSGSEDRGSCVWHSVDVVLELPVWNIYSDTSYIWTQRQHIQISAEFTLLVSSTRVEVCVCVCVSPVVVCHWFCVCVCVCVWVCVWDL